MDRKLIDSIATAWQEVVEKKRKEALDPVDKDELKGKHADRDDKDIDNDGDVDSSDEYLHKRRKAISKNEEIDQDMDKDGMKKCAECGGSSENHDPECSKYDSAEKKKMSEEDMDDKSATKALKHDCASHVTSEQWGYGECIPGEHTLVEQEDGTAIVTHYDVMFEHGVEFDVPVEELTIVSEKSHIHAQKMTPKQKQKAQKSASANKSYGNVRDRLAKEGVEEGKTYAERSKGAAPTEKMLDKYKGKGAKDMGKENGIDDPKQADITPEEEGHDDATKAGRVTKLSKLRPGEKRVGHLNPEKPKDTTK